jgi:hypothetical protein
MGTKLLKLEFSEPINPIRGLEKYEKIRLLVCYQGVPLQWVEISNGIGKSNSPSSVGPANKA